MRFVRGGKKAGENLALVASTGEEEKVQDIPMITDCPEDMKHEFSDHMAFVARTFWKNPSKAKEQNYQRKTQLLSNDLS